MKKLSIIVAAGIVTFSVTSAAQALCNIDTSGTFNGLDGLITAQDTRIRLKPGDSNIFTNVLTNAGTGDGGPTGTLIGERVIGVQQPITCFNVEQEDTDTDPGESGTNPQ